MSEVLQHTAFPQPLGRLSLPAGLISAVTDGQGPRDKEAPGGQEANASQSFAELLWDYPGNIPWGGDGEEGQLFHMVQGQFSCVPSRGR